MVKKTVIEQLQQLQSVSEGAIEKQTQHQAARSALSSAAQLRERGDRILRGLDSVEDRLTAIEKRLAALERQGRKRSAKTGSGTGKSRSAEAKAGAGDADRSGAGEEPPPEPGP